MPKFSICILPSPFRLKIDLFLIFSYIVNMDIEVYILNSFAKTSIGGNPAGVVLNSDITEKQMLSIAKIVGFSETAFLNKINTDSYSIRFFTPCAEVDLCGHATIAAFSLLKIKNLISEGKYKLNTKVGKIDITINNEKIFMTQKLDFIFYRVES